MILIKDNIEIKTIRSPYPFVTAGVVYIVGTFILPMYKLSSYLILLAAAIALYAGLRVLHVFKDDTIEVEIPKTYESKEVEALIKNGQQKVDELKSLVYRIENSSMVNDIEGIISTSEAIIDLIDDNNEMAGKVKKYFNYYLDEIIHIIKEYDDFEEDQLNVENVKVSKENIEKTIANANQSFLKFYNDLYVGKAMDIDVDLKVFDSMLGRLS